MVQDENRMRYVPELYFKSPEEMRELFRDFPEAIANTLEIGERCNLDLEFGKSKYPEYPVPAGKTREDYLRELCDERFAAALRRTRGERSRTDQTARLRAGRSRENRLRQLHPHCLGFHSFRQGDAAFRWDLDADRLPVRWSLTFSGITDIDPLQYGLIFERFLESGSCFAAGYRRRFLRSASRRSARIRPAEIRRTPRRADHHLWQTEGEERGSRRRSRDGPELSRCRSHREDDSKRAEYHARFSRGKKSGTETRGRHRAADPAAV